MSAKYNYRTFDSRTSNKSPDEFRNKSADKIVLLKSFEFDEFLTKYFNDLGFYQTFVICLLAIPGCLLSACGTMDIVFLSFTPNHTCKVDSIISNQTESIDRCTYIVKSDDFNNDSSEIIRKCNEWEYDKTYFDETLVTQWDLVCDKALIIRTIVSIASLANVISALYSIVQDKYGRKMAFLLNLTVYLIGSCSSVWSQSPTVFAITKFIAGISCFWAICYCWALEFVGPSKRTLVAVLLSFLYACSNIAVMGLAYISSTWRQLAFMTSFPFILLFSYTLFVPESPRWLLTKGDVSASVKILKRMLSWEKFKTSNIGLEPDQILQRYNFVQQTRNVESEKFSFAEFFKSRNLLLKNAIVTLANVLTNQLYVAVPFSVENMGTENYYLTYVLQAVVEPPAVLINLLFLNRIGRVLPLSFFMITGGILCVLTWPFQDGPSWLITLITMIGRFLICVGVPIIAQLGNELYPTVVRGTGNSITLIVVSLVNVTTQYILYTSTIWKALPMIIMGSTTVVAGFVVLFLPETKNCQLPDTVEDAERQGSVGITSFKAHFKL